MHISYGQDCENILPESYGVPLELGDYKYIKQEKRKVYDFVGFIINDTNTLAVFPKHFYNESDLSNLNATISNRLEDVSLLFQVLCKYIYNDLKSSKANRYYGSVPEYEADYPFKAFFDVYDYYKKYGIYFQEDNHIVKGQTGKISWKHTIQKANTVISNGNLLFVPLYSKKKNIKNDFISECMVFVINHTIESFPFLINLSPVSGFAKNNNLINNRAYILKLLYQEKNRMFKDIHKKLVSSLIQFFEEFDSKKHGGNIHLKINYFNNIWQTMVNKYLNDCFIGISATEDEILFDDSLQKSAVSFDKQTIHIDDSNNDFYIELDHYGIAADEQYIFDSKYYFELRDLNYKQFTYDVILDYKANKSRKTKTYSALLLPGDKQNGFHFRLKPVFGKLAEKDHEIINQYLNVKKIMQHYIR